MQPIEAVAMMMFFIMMVGVFPALVLRYKAMVLRHRERMEAFERGMPVQEGPTASPLAPEVNYQLKGLKWSFVGLAICAVLFFIPPIIGNRHEWQRLDEMKALAAMHYSSEEVRQMVRENDNHFENERKNLRGLAALGLIPTAIGIAYLAYDGERRRRMMMIDPPAARLVRSDQ